MEQATVELGKLETGKTLWQYKEEISRLTGVHPIFINIKFEKNEAKTKIVDITPSISKAGVVQKALNIGLVGIEIREVESERPGVEIEAKAYFMPDVAKVATLLDELLRVADHMTLEDVGAIAKDIFRLRGFMNRAHRSTEDDSLNKRQKPYMLELAITTALTRVLGDATGYGLAQLDHTGEADAAVADDAVEEEGKIEDRADAGEDLSEEAESIDDIEMKRDLAKSTIMTAIETLGWPTAKGVLSFEGEREDFEYTLETVDFPILAEEAEKLVAKVNAVFAQEEERGDKGTEEKPDSTVS